MGDTGLTLSCRQLRLPRQGSNLEEFQDASASDPEQGRFAIADGATESPHAGLWARLLVEAFVHDGEVRLAWANWLPAIQQQWASAVSPQLNDPPLPWYLEPGFQQGAFATFLGLVLRRPHPCEQGAVSASTPWTWEALALGDSCLFQTRGDQLVRAFPVSRSGDFDSTPWLVGSRTEPRRGGEVCQGEFWPQDRLWLMTDALAQWFLGQVENGGKPWQIAESLLDRGDTLLFADWVAQQRDSRQLRNDDVTLMEVSSCTFSPRPSG